MSEIVQIYELAYHLDPKLEESAALEMRQELEQLLASKGASLVFTREPEKTKLSYEINHQRSSYFGYFHFSITDKEQLAIIDEQLRLNKKIIRSIILKLDPPSKKKLKPRSLAGQQKAQERAAKKAEGVTSEPNPEMEKQIEEVMGKI